MNADQLSWGRSAAAGFALTVGFYLLCIIACVLMAQFMPVGSACTLGTPVLPLLFGYGFGIFWGLFLVGKCILERASAFDKGSLSAHVLVLGIVLICVKLWR
ncbi:hypothetical protein [Hymenobacter jeollabukensis]|uniref:Uncharacterized protein n=1 Tax=Hymenobacter jeollabukensis TaxID=2025313 RepID=A0A5R8WX49_9BACT|nr:hypothetical protein [Hymenobacter jeollabukensis]TLM96764.1 hypothetical protein FDY95_01845 [Hymenobacter jeollabukensis]